ncbi:MAG: O-antigen ligase family protein [Thermoleophilia bacterium]|nr:O-antigen ligase family protein [Thermoleophilia bacterium]
MKVVESSLSYRAARPAWWWIVGAARDSLVGRFLMALTRTLGSVFSDSRTFGTRHLRPRRLQRDGHPLSVLAISRPYLWLRDRLGGGGAGRAATEAGRAFAASRLAGGVWVFVVGAGLFALGCGRLALMIARGVTTVEASGLSLAVPWLRFVTPVIVMAVGALLLASGPRLVPAFRTSLVGRGIGLAVDIPPGEPAALAAGEKRGPLAEPSPGPGSWRRLVGVAGAAVVLAAAAGAAAGLTAGSGALVVPAVAIAVCLFALAVLRPEAMLLAVAAFPWLDWVARSFLGGLGPAWDEALLIFCAALLLWSVIVLRRGELWTVPITLPALLALVAAIGSVVVRDVPGDVALFALRVLFQPLLFYFVGFLLPKSRRWVQGAVAVFLAASVAMALHGLYQYVTHAPMPARWVDVRETYISTRAYSVVGNPNGLGAFLVIGALVTFSLALSSKLFRSRRLLLGAACAVQVAGVAVTFSRGAWIGLAAGLVALLLLAYRRFLAPLVVAAVVAWFAAPQAFVNRLTSGFSSWYITKSLAGGRLYVWKMSLEDIAAHPWFGLGLGTFGGTTAVTFGYGRLWVDNFYLQLGAEGGLILLVLFLWVLLRGAKGLVKAHRTARDPYLRALSAGVFGAFVAVAVANVTASVWEALVVGAGFWFLAGLTTSAGLQNAEEPAPDGQERS